MKYLVMKNVGEAPLEALTIFGVSTTGQASTKGTIGQFGTGAKQATCLLLRHGLQPIIFSGKNKLTFTTRPLIVNDSLDSFEFSEVISKITRYENGRANTKTASTGFTLEVGEHDWTRVDQALREFLSNVIDRSIRESTARGENVRPQIYLTDSVPTGEEGTTTFVVPASIDVIDFFKKSPEAYLHLNYPELLDQTVLDPTPRRREVLGAGPHFYRMGCYLHVSKEIAESGRTSAFDYNLPSTLTINECREVAQSNLLWSLGSALDAATIEQKMKVLRELHEDSQLVESLISSYCFCSYGGVKQSWFDAWEKLSGGAKLALGHDEVNLAHENNIKPYYLPKCGLSEHLTKSGIETVTSLLTEKSEMPQGLMPPSEELTRVFDKIWDFFNINYQTGFKEKPTLLVFPAMPSQPYLVGSCYLETKTIVIRQDEANDPLSINCLKALMEEMLHYTSGLTDYSAGYQEVLIQTIAWLLSKRGLDKTLEFMQSWN